ncbi:hypothetical protein [Actinomyces radicidentis]|uniref:hypothetical protein n=1 Tax=Actinomyces radicidentis TaxID=111015 RepID=UPI0026E012B3|nr:hypothetical protein [Actinomyces radicidentis]
MPTYETEDGEPRYGKRLSPEELAEYLREQGIEPSGTAAARGADGAGAGRARGARGAVAGGAGVDAGRRSSRENVRASGGALGDGSSWRDDAAQGTDPYRAPVPGRPGEDRSRSVAAPPTGASRRRRSWGSRWGLLTVGLVLLIAVPLVLTAIAVELVVQGPLSSGTVLGSAGTVYLDAGDHQAVYTSSIGGSTTSCTVEDPSGNAVALDDPDDTGLPYASFTASASGRYTVTCPGGTEGMVVGPTMDSSHVDQAGILMATALGVGLIGLGATVAGGVRAARR